MQLDSDSDLSPRTAFSRAFLSRIVDDLLFCFCQHVVCFRIRPLILQCGNKNHFSIKTNLQNIILPSLFWSLECCLQFCEFHCPVPLNVFFFFCLVVVFVSSLLCLFRMHFSELIENVLSVALICSSLFSLRLLHVPFFPVTHLGWRKPSPWLNQPKRNWKKPKWDRWKVVFSLACGLILKFGLS